jgi:hypothetical protein
MLGRKAFVDPNSKIGGRSYEKESHILFPSMNTQATSKEMHHQY